jgi:hypothetical protein
LQPDLCVPHHPRSYEADAVAGEGLAGDRARDEGGRRVRALVVVGRIVCVIGAIVVLYALALCLERL